MTTNTTTNTMTTTTTTAMTDQQRLVAQEIKSCMQAWTALRWIVAQCDSARRDDKDIEGLPDDLGAAYDVIFSKMADLTEDMIKLKAALSARYEYLADVWKALK